MQRFTGTMRLPVLGATGGIVGGVVGEAVGGLIGAAIGGVVGAVTLLILLVTKHGWDHGTVRARYFTYDIIVIVVLAGLAIWYLRENSSLHAFLPKPLEDLPLAAIWFGSLGGITISLIGIYGHGNSEWDEKFNLWHAGRVVTAGIAGGITYIFLQVISGGAPTRAAVFAAAFIVGVQERRFIDLISKIGGLVFGTPPDKSMVTPIVLSVQPRSAPVGANFVITGVGFAQGLKIKIGGILLEKPQVIGGTTIKGVLPSGTGKVDLTLWNPDGAAWVEEGAMTYTNGDTLAATV